MVVSCERVRLTMLQHRCQLSRAINSPGIPSPLARIGRPGCAALAVTHVPFFPTSDQADLIKDGDSDGGAWDAQVDYDNALHGAEMSGVV